MRNCVNTFDTVTKNGNLLMENVQFTQNKQIYSDLTLKRSQSIFTINCIVWILRRTLSIEEMCFDIVVNLVLNDC